MFRDFVEATRSDPWVWGRNDCCLWPALGWEHVTGRNPAADLMGTYTSLAGCNRIMRKAGGLLPLCQALMAGERSGETQNGIGVVSDGRQIVGAILIDGIAHIRTTGGLLISSEFDLLEGWGV